MITIWPYGIDIVDWFDNLIIDYPFENLPILRDPEEWEEIASIIAATGIFANKGCPTPLSINQQGLQKNYTNWQEWAKDVYSIMIIFNKDRTNE